MCELEWNYFFTEKISRSFITFEFCTNFIKKIGTKQCVSNFVRSALENSGTIWSKHLGYKSNKSVKNASANAVKADFPTEPLEQTTKCVSDI